MNNIEFMNYLYQEPELLNYLRYHPKWYKILYYEHNYDEFISYAKQVLHLRLVDKMEGIKRNINIIKSLGSYMK